MGEYAKHNGHEVKIGTCEDFYYLRADQRSEISGYGFGEQMLAVVRFRFPFPDEDSIEPGAFEDYDRGVRVPGGYQLPAELSGDEHHRIQFTSPAGYNLCIPCPEAFELIETVGAAGEHYPLTVHRNGWNGGPRISQQAYRGGALVTLLRCGSCGAVHRLDTIDDARPVIEAFRDEAVREEWRRLFDDAGNLLDDYGFVPEHTGKSRENLLAIADRIEAGYAVAVEA